MKAFSKPLSKLSADDIRQRRGQVLVDKTDFRQEHRGTFVEDVHAALDDQREAARGWIEGTFANATQLVNVDHLVLRARIELVGDNAYWQRLHHAVDQAPAGTFATLSRKEYDDGLDGFDSAIAELDDEFARRQRIAEEALADAGMETATR